MTHAALSTILVLFLLLVMPVWGWLDMRHLKRRPSHAALTRSYLLTVGVMWLLSVLCALLTQPAILWSAPPALTLRLHLDAVPTGALIGLMGGLLIGLVVPVILVRRAPGSLDAQMAPVSFMLPRTTLQRWLFALVCITAGMCEEWIYRGFVLHFLVMIAPALAAWAVVIASALLFGIAHIYQGRVGTIMTTILGAVLALLYLAAGSLLLPMLIHALIDLRIFLLLPALGFAAPAAADAAPKIPSRG